MIRRVQAAFIGLLPALICAVLITFAISRYNSHSNDQLYTTSSKRYDPVQNRSSHSLSDNPDRPGLVRRWQTCDWEATAKSVEQKPDPEQWADHCEKALGQGTYLACMITSTDASKYASKWTGFEQIKSFGWDDEPAEAAEYDPMTITEETLGLETFFEQFDISTEQNDWVGLFQRHSRDSRDTLKDESYPATGASYSNYFNIKQGTLIAGFNVSPKGVNMNRAKKVPPQAPFLPLPPVQNWSELVFFGMKSYAEFINSLDTLKKLRHIIQANISNDETKEVLGQILGREKIEESDAFGSHEFTIDDPEAKAALGTPNGKGVAWLLGQHRQVLGDKYVDKIQIFNCPDEELGETMWCLYFHIEDSPSTTDVGQGEGSELGEGTEPGQGSKD